MIMCFNTPMVNCVEESLMDEIFCEIALISNQNDICLIYNLGKCAALRRARKRCKNFKFWEGTLFHISEYLFKCLTYHTHLTPHCLLLTAGQTSAGGVSYGRSQLFLPWLWMQLQGKSLSHTGNKFGTYFHATMLKF